jgi:plastocyanin
MLIKRASFWLAIFAMVSLLALAAACKKSEEAEGPGGAAGGATDSAANQYKPTGNEGTIGGSIALSGTPAEAKKIDMSADPECAKKNPNGATEDVVAKGGKLEYAFVYIKDGTTADGKKIGDLGFAAPADTVTLDQNGCHYKPHVLGLQTGQKLNVINSDPTTHNVHPTPKNNQEWNQSQTAGAPPIVKSFTRAETLIPVKCNQHPWMKAYIGVLKHPFFAVSGEDGSFQIKGVPPGKYTLVAWHEKFGEQTKDVTVDSKGTATAEFSFSATAAASTQRKGTLEVVPALDLPMLMRH